MEYIGLYLIYNIRMVQFLALLKHSKKDLGSLWVL